MLLSSVYRDVEAAKLVHGNPGLSGRHACANAHGWNIDIVAITNQSSSKYSSAGNGVAWNVSVEGVWSLHAVGS